MSVNISELVDLLVKFQGVEREILIPELSRKENDAEHSYNLAMTAWLIVAKDKLPLDLDLVIKYALVHDLVEVYAGDAFVLNDKEVEGKAAKEHEALRKLVGTDMTKEFAKLVEQYEAMNDDESKFIYGLDKLMPAFTLIHGRVNTWKQYGITQQAWEDKFRTKIERSKYLKPYLDQLIELQKTNLELLAD